MLESRDAAELPGILGRAGGIGDGLRRPELPVLFEGPVDGDAWKGISELVIDPHHEGFRKERPRNGGLTVARDRTNGRRRRDRRIRDWGFETVRRGGSLAAETGCPQCQQG
jgi:hypothetical protein